MSYTSHIEQVCADRGIDAAYKAALRTIRDDSSRLDALWNSRFFERRVLDNGAKKLWPVTESQISSAIDMQDCDPEPREFLYCDDDGVLYPVTIGGQRRHDADPDGPDETPFCYASSDMVANGKVVGHVEYTDH